MWEKIDWLRWVEIGIALLGAAGVLGMILAWLQKRRPVCGVDYAAHGERIVHGRLIIRSRHPHETLRIDRIGFSKPQPTIPMMADIVIYDRPTGSIRMSNPYRQSWQAEEVEIKPKGEDEIEFLAELPEKFSPNRKLVLDVQYTWLGATQRHGRARVRGSVPAVVME